MEFSGTIACALVYEPGQLVQARKNLEYIRGTKDVDVEFNDIVEAAELAAAVKHPWRNLFSAKYRPQLVLSACCTLFQQWTGRIFLLLLSSLQKDVVSTSVVIEQPHSPCLLHGCMPIPSTWHGLATQLFAAMPSFGLDQKDA